MVDGGHKIISLLNKRTVLLGYLKIGLYQAHRGYAAKADDDFDDIFGMMNASKKR